jgi:hypothetical protein
MSKTEQLQIEVQSLPEKVAGQVLDFLAAINTAQGATSAHQRALVRRLRGSWRGKLSTSEEFAARKADEIRLEE